MKLLTLCPAITIKLSKLSSKRPLEQEHTYESVLEAFFKGSFVRIKKQPLKYKLVFQKNIKDMKI